MYIIKHANPILREWAEHKRVSPKKYLLLLIISYVNGTKGTKMIQFIKTGPLNVILFILEIVNEVSQ
jgi:hypothetical protein